MVWDSYTRTLYTRTAWSKSLSLRRAFSYVSQRRYNETNSSCEGTVELDVGKEESLLVEAIR